MKNVMNAGSEFDKLVQIDDDHPFGGQLVAPTHFRYRRCSSNDTVGDIEIVVHRDTISICKARDRRFKIWGDGNKELGHSIVTIMLQKLAEKSGVVAYRR